MDNLIYSISDFLFWRCLAKIGVFDVIRRGKEGKVFVALMFSFSRFLLISSIAFLLFEYDVEFEGESKTQNLRSIADFPSLPPQALHPSTPSWKQ